jgi:hypothetical protein
VVNRFFHLTIEDTMPENKSQWNSPDEPGGVSPWINDPFHFFIAF